MKYAISFVFTNKQNNVTRIKVFRVVLKCKPFSAWGMNGFLTFRMSMMDKTGPGWKKTLSVFFIPMAPLVRLFSAF